MKFNFTFQLLFATFLASSLASAEDDRRHHQCEQSSGPKASCNLDLTVAVDMSWAMKSRKNVQNLSNFTIQNIIDQYAIGHQNSRIAIQTLGSWAFSQSPYFEEFKHACEFITHAADTFPFFGNDFFQISKVFSSYLISNVLPTPRKRVVVIITAINDPLNINAAIPLANLVRKTAHVVVVGISQKNQKYLERIADDAIFIDFNEYSKAVADEIVSKTCPGNQNSSTTTTTTTTSTTHAEPTTAPEIATTVLPEVSTTEMPMEPSTAQPGEPSTTSNQPEVTTTKSGETTVVTDEPETTTMPSTTLQPGASSTGIPQEPSTDSPIDPSTAQPGELSTTSNQPEATTTKSEETTVVTDEPEVPSTTASPSDESTTHQPDVPSTDSPIDQSTEQPEVTTTKAAETTIVTDEPEVPSTTAAPSDESTTRQPDVPSTDIPQEPSTDSPTDQSTAQPEVPSTSNQPELPTTTSGVTDEPQEPSTDSSIDQSTVQPSEYTTLPQTEMPTEQPVTEEPVSTTENLIDATTPESEETSTLNPSTFQPEEPSTLAPVDVSTLEPEQPSTNVPLESTTAFPVEVSTTPKEESPSSTSSTGDQSTLNPNEPSTGQPEEATTLGPMEPSTVEPEPSTANPEESSSTPPSEVATSALPSTKHPEEASTLTPNESTNQPLASTPESEASSKQPEEASTSGDISTSPHPSTVEVGSTTLNSDEPSSEKPTGVPAASSTLAPEEPSTTIESSEPSTRPSSISPSTKIPEEISTEAPVDSSSSTLPSSELSNIEPGHSSTKIPEEFSTEAPADSSTEYPNAPSSTPSDETLTSESASSQPSTQLPLEPSTTGGQNEQSSVSGDSSTSPSMKPSTSEEPSVPTTNAIPSESPQPEEPTTTFIPTTQNPLSNALGSKCSTNTTGAWLDIVFVVDTSAAMTTLELNRFGGLVAGLFRRFTIAQDSQHSTRIAIVTYGKETILQYNLESIKDWATLYSVFTSMGKFRQNDKTSDISLGLLAAEKVLASQKSHRIPAIVLVGASTNTASIPAAGTVSKRIITEGTKIITINFAVSLDATEAPLNALASSPSFGLVSSDPELYSKLTLAFTKVNCACPRLTYQFQINATEVFGDCIQGFNGQTPPDIAQMMCEMSNGFLVSVTSQEKLDFIRTQVVKNVFGSNPEFTIGLHRIPKFENNEWYWFGYNNTVFPIGEFKKWEDGKSPSPSAGCGYATREPSDSGMAFAAGGCDYEDARPYLCQTKACDSAHICDLESGLKAQKAHAKTQSEMKQRMFRSGYKPS